MKQKRRNESSSIRESERVGEFAPKRLTELIVPGRRQETKVRLPTGEPDLEALRSVTREWLVPLLVEKFLRERGIELRGQRSSAGPGRTPISDL
jgi:hypothetical protein